MGPTRLPATLLLAVSLGVVVRRLGVDWRWLPLAVLLVPDLDVATGLLLRGACAGLPAGFPWEVDIQSLQLGECWVKHRFEASGYH